MYRFVKFASEKNSLLIKKKKYENKRQKTIKRQQFIKIVFTHILVLVIAIQLRIVSQMKLKSKKPVNYSTRRKKKKILEN